MLNTMANVRWEHYPHVVGNELARAWLVLESNLGLAANTLDAYGRALQDYLAFSADQNTPVITATKDHIAEYVRHLTSRPGQRGPNVVVLDSDAGLANATLRQRISSRIPEWGVAANKYPNKQGQTRGQAFKDFYATLDKLHVPFGPAFYYAHSPGGSSRIDANGALLPEAKTLALDGGEHSIAPLPEQTGGTDAKARTVIVGVNIWNEQFLSKADQDNELEQMAASGVKVIRTGLVDYNMEFIIKPYQHGISTVAIVFPFPGSKTWSDVILSKITPEEFTAKFKPLLEKLEIAGVRLDAFELGNEINTSRFNGDLPNPGSGRELRLADLNSPKDPEASAVARSYRAYVQVMAALKDLRDHSKLNQHTPILSAGLAQKLGTKQVEVILRDSIEFFRQNGIDKLVDGYGIHVYPSADLKRPVSARITSLDEDMFSACRQGGKPCWVTKWGFGNSDESCPAVEGTRVKLVQDMRIAFQYFASQGLLKGLIYYDWTEQPGKPDSWAIFRCGALTDAGKVALGPMDLLSSTAVGYRITKFVYSIVLLGCLPLMLSLPAFAQTSDEKNARAATAPCLGVSPNTVHLTSLQLCRYRCVAGAWRGEVAGGSCSSYA